MIGADISGTGESVILFLDEAPYSRSTPDKSAFTVKVDGNAFTPTLVYFLAPSRIVLDIRSAVTVRPGETVTVSYTKPATNPLQDAEGIETESFTDFPVENNIPPIAPDAPANLQAKGASTTQIDLFWHAPAYTGGADITGYRIEVSTTGAGGWSDVVANTGSTSTTYSHTVPSGATRYYRVSAINSAGAGTASGVASGNATNTPPGVIRAEIPREGVLRVLFDEALDSTSTPDASAFTIAVEENTYTPLTTVILASPPAIQLVLPANDTVRGGDTVTISYTTPETNPLRDAGGLETAPFTNLPVDNKLPPVKPDAPTNLNAQGVSRTGIDLSWDPPAKTGGAHITGYRIEVSSTGDRGLVQPSHGHGLDVDDVLAHGAVGRHAPLPGLGDQLRRRGAGLGRGLRHGHQHAAKGDPCGHPGKHGRCNLATPRRIAGLDLDAYSVGVHDQGRRGRAYAGFGVLPRQSESNTPQLRFERRNEACRDSNRLLHEA